MCLGQLSLLPEATLSWLIFPLINRMKPPYTPVEGDSVRFAMKSSYEDTEPVLVKNIPIGTLKLVIEPDDTKKLPFGQYVYDVQITKASGEVDTFITKARLKLTEEVY